MAVLCFGKVSLYSVRGDLQLYVDDMEPQGQGALYLAFEQLKKETRGGRLICSGAKKAAAIFAGDDWYRELRSAARRYTTCCGSFATVTPIGVS